MSIDDLLAVTTNDIGSVTTSAMNPNDAEAPLAKIFTLKLGSVVLNKCLLFFDMKLSSVKTLVEAL